MGADAYSALPGFATITELREPDSYDYNIGEAVVVVFDFAPDDPQVRERYLFPEVSDAGHRLTNPAGANLPRSWVSRAGLEVGRAVRCYRRELRVGVGPPVLFDFPDLHTDVGLASDDDRAQPDDGSPPLM